MTAKEPTKQTLAKYGLSLEGWLNILIKQGGVCAICRKLPSTGRLCVEHFHRKGWKQLPPEERRKDVRGLCCFACNTQYLGRGITVEKARNVLAYLEAFEGQSFDANGT